MLRRLSTTVLSLSIVVAGGAALAAVRAHHTHANCLDTVWRTDPVSTSSSAFVKVPGLTDSPVSIFPMTVTVSAEVSGAPVEFRVRSTNVGEQTTTNRPGSIRFVPGSGGDAFSFQWIDPGGSAAVHVHDLVLQWRSPSGRPLTMTRGDMSVAYQTEAGACIGA